MELAKWIKSKSGKTPQKASSLTAQPVEKTYPITFEMMLKGSVYKRRGGNIRQFGVTVDGSTRLVTSGDLVDRATYNALVGVGAIRDLETSTESAPTQSEEKSHKNRKKEKRQKAVGQ